MHSMEIEATTSQPRGYRYVPDSVLCPWLTISIGVGFFAFLTVLLGLMVLSVSLIDLVKMSQNNLDVVKREKFDAKGYKIPSIKIKPTKVWFGAAGSGVAAGIIQIISSSLFIYNIFREDEKKMTFNTNLWILCQFVVLVMFLTTFGAIYIAGFYANNMIRILGIDFVFLNLFILISIIILRRDVGQLQKENRKTDAGGISALTALLVL